MRTYLEGRHGVGVCRQCGAQFTRTKKAQVFCQRSCRNKSYGIAQGKPDEPTPVARGTIGAIGELLVSADLLRLNLPVYRAVSQSAPVDLAVLNGSSLIGVEVRTGYRLNSGKVTFSKKFQHADVFAVAVRKESPLYLPITEAGRAFIEQHSLRTE